MEETISGRSAPVARQGIKRKDVQDLVITAVKNRIGRIMIFDAIERLTDSDSCFIARDTALSVARNISLEPCTTPVRGPQWNSIAEAFVKTSKRLRLGRSRRMRKPLSLNCVGPSITTIFTRTVFSIDRRANSPVCNFKSEHVRPFGANSATEDNPKWLKADSAMLPLHARSSVSLGVRLPVKCLSNKGSFQGA